ncbi:MAG: hypothetical protein WBP70_12710, partial [Terriglobales bacterium]
VFSAHAFFLSGCAVETREFRGTASASNRVFPQPAKLFGNGIAVAGPYPTSYFMNYSGPVTDPDNDAIDND